MPKKISDIALAKVSSFANRVSLFQSELQITRHASGTIVDYSHALYKAVAHIGKLPEEFTQEDADGYLSYLLSRQPQPAVSQFKHFIYGLKSYLHAMGYPDLAGLALPRIRREKRLPRVLSVEQVQVIYSRPPAKGVSQVLEYVGRYAYRVAISNSRILDYDAEMGTVAYDYKDYRHGGCHKTMSMSAVEFLHLFSLHILPPAFVRIRHYGLLSPSNRDKLRKVQEQLGGTPLPKERRKKTYMEVCELQGWEIGICPHCKCRMIVIETIAPARAPPLSVHVRTASV